MMFRDVSGRDPGISTLRWFLLVSSLLISIISLILGVQSFRVSEGEIQIFEDAWLRLADENPLP
jgi:hypothetical protein